MSIPWRLESTVNFSCSISPPSASSPSRSKQYEVKEPSAAFRFLKKKKYKWVRLPTTSQKPKPKEFTSQACSLSQLNKTIWEEQFTNPVYKPTTLPRFTLISALTPHPRSELLNISMGISRGRWEIRFRHLSGRHEQSCKRECQHACFWINVAKSLPYYIQ